MIIDFENLQTQTFPQFKGGEGEYRVKAFTAPDGNKMMYGCLAPQASIGMHTHTDSCEIIYALQGCGTVRTPQGDELLPAGGFHYCPKGASHSLCNTGTEPLIFFAAVPNQ